jgi:hypothetical protein
MPRKRNPRVIAVGILKDIKDLATGQRTRWMSRSSRYILEAPDGYTVQRLRTPEEYPENSSAEWASLWCYADALEEKAALLKAHALANWKAFPGNEDYTLTRKADV